MTDYSTIRATFDDSTTSTVLLKAIIEHEIPIDLVIYYANAAAAKLWDATPEEMMGKTLHEVGRNLDGKLLDIYQELLINGQPRTVYDYSTARDRHLKLDCFYCGAGLMGCKISIADLDVGFTFSPTLKSKDGPMTDLEKAVSKITTVFAIYDSESYNLDNETDYICFSDIATREILEISTSDKGSAAALFGDGYQGKTCYELMQDRKEPCSFCPDKPLHSDRYHVWQAYNAKLNRNYLHRTKMVKVDNRFIRMDVAQDVTDDARKSKLLTETIEGMSLWSECMGALSGEISLNNAAKMIIENMGNFFQASSAFIALYSSAIYTAGWSSEGGYRIPPMFAAPTSEALQEWKTLMKSGVHVLVSDATDERIPPVLKEHFAASGITSTQLTPIFVGNELKGIICINNTARNRGQGFLIDMIATSLAHALRQVELQEHMETLRFRDSLTDELNFDGFKYIAKKCIKENPDKKYSLWYCDIRRFKYVNDMFGFEVGDRFLQYWSASLANDARPGETFCRISADTFTVLCYYDDSADLHHRFKKRNDLLGSFPELQDKNFKPEMVAGIYLLDEEDMKAPDINKMLNLANIAQKNVKPLSGKQMSIFDNSMREQQVRELTISQHLEDGLRKREFFVYLQPQINFTTQEIVGAEALIRWNHPTLGRLSPTEFIPLLEKAGLISELDFFVWEEACKYLRYMLDNQEKLTAVPLSVNISRVDLYRSDLSERILSLVKKYDIPQELLNLEITESAYTEDSDQLIAVVEELRECGFAVEMDDFGSGYSSLNILKEVPVDVLKLDMKFLAMSDYVVGGFNNERGGSILGSVVHMAHGISLPVIAEGVETREQAEYLKSLGCYMMQGYYFAEPMSFEDFKKFLTHTPSGKMKLADNRGDALRATEFLSTDGATSFLFTNCIGGGCLLEFDGQDLQALLLNDQFFVEIGIARVRCDFYRTRMMSICEPEDREAFVQCFKDAVENGSSIAYMRPMRDDGETRWVRGVNRYIATRDQRHLIFSVIEDVTDSYLSQEKIAEEEDRFKGFETLMSGGFFRLAADDGDDSFDFISEGFADMFGYTREEFQKHFHNRFFEVVYEHDRQQVRSALATSGSVGATKSLEYRVETAGGELVFVHTELCIVADRNGKRWYYGHVVKKG
ncbi:MAG: EAL domain-containing protein [Eggerthellaceae bacterium]|nr:EAL domain-containing protein [Eggerthellaceae bacterium]